MMNQTRTEVEFYGGEGSWTWRVWWITPDPNADYPAPIRKEIFQRAFGPGSAGIVFASRARAEVDAQEIAERLGRKLDHGHADENDKRVLIALLAWELGEDKT